MQTTYETDERERDPHRRRRREQEKRARRLELVSSPTDSHPLSKSQGPWFVTLHAIESFQKRCPWAKEDRNEAREQILELARQSRPSPSKVGIWIPPNRAPVVFVVAPPTHAGWLPVLLTAIPRFRQKQEQRQ